jgi:hypothetical protein
MILMGTKSACIGLARNGCGRRQASLPPIADRREERRNRRRTLYGDHELVEGAGPRQDRRGGPNHQTRPYQRLVRVGDWSCVESGLDLRPTLNLLRLSCSLGFLCHRWAPFERNFKGLLPRTICSLRVRCNTSSPVGSGGLEQAHRAPLASFCAAVVFGRSFTAMAGRISQEG